MPNQFNLESNIYSFQKNNKIYFVIPTIIIFILLIYSNSFYCEWLFDDYANIVNNNSIHIKSLSEFKKAFYLYEKINNRPIAGLTFAINYYLGELDVFGYHLVNITIHCISSFFLFFFIYSTLNLPIVPEQYKKNSYSITILSVFFWLSSPINVNAITYIVQRMTSMSGMFYIMSMYFYLKGRTSAFFLKKIIYISITFICTLLAVGTKETSVTIPISIFLFDLMLIQGITKESLKKNFRVAIPLLLLTSIFILLYKDISDIFNYAPWVFTIKERLLTECRVLLFYISLIIYPLSNRLTMEHDISISNSLINPTTTLPSIIILISIIIYAAAISHKKPFISFFIFFFFLNHIVEGSFIPIDICFEHRNYIPSVSLFIIQSIIIVHFVNFFSYNQFIQSMIVFLITFLLAAQGHTTYSRNHIFRYEKLVWKDNIDKYPNISRPHINLGQLLLQDINDYRQGYLETFMGLYTRPIAYKKKELGLCYNNISLYFSNFKKDYDKALNYLWKSITTSSLDTSYYGIGIIMLKKGLFIPSIESIKTAIHINPRRCEYYNVLAIGYLKSDKTDLAMKSAGKALKIKEDNYVPYAIIAEGFHKNRKYNSAIFYWEKFLTHEPTNIVASAALIDLYNKNCDKKMLRKHIARMIILKGDKTFSQLFEVERASTFNLIYSINKDLLLSIIKKELIEFSTEN